MSKSEETRDRMVLHAVRLERMKNHDAKQLRRLIDDVEEDLVKKLQRLEWHSVAHAGNKRRRYQRTLREMQELSRDAAATFRDDVGTRIDGLIRVERDFTVNMLEVADVPINVPTMQRVLGAVKARPFEGELLSEFTARWGTNLTRRVQSGLIMSFVEGESLQESIKRMREAMVISKRGAELVIRTSYAHVASTTRTEVYKENSDQVTREMYSAVLDHRTTFICATLDGQVFPLNSGPRPPQHFQCRSITVPVFRYEKPPKHERYGPWLERQRPSVQDEVLGKTRGKLLRDEKLKFYDFIDDTGKLIPLEELAKLEGIDF
jgi:SPP1 gp7 family putative phage head morphogenesis protein